MPCVVTLTAGYSKVLRLSSMENAHIMLKMAANAQIMLEIEEYAFSCGLCFSRQIMLKIMPAYCINAYRAHGATFRSRGADSERSHLICILRAADGSNF